MGRRRTADGVTDGQWSGRTGTGDKADSDSRSSSILSTSSPRSIKSIAIQIYLSINSDHSGSGGREAGGGGIRNWDPPSPLHSLSHTHTPSLPPLPYAPTHTPHYTPGIIISIYCLYCVFLSLSLHSMYTFLRLTCLSLFHVPSIVFLP